MANKTRAFVCGWPINHSRSPIIHNHWIKKYGLVGNYEKLAVEPDKLQDFLTGFKNRGFAGGNITIPHKENAALVVDSSDPVAEALGAVNTVWMAGGKLHGANTDGYGFLANLDQKVPGWDTTGDDSKTAIVLGAGGASRAIIHALQSRGYNEIRIVNRTLSRADIIARKFGIKAFGFNSLAKIMKDADLLVNTTSLGMTGHDPLEIDITLLPASCLVTDIVYVPLETELLKKARFAGLKTVDGLGMLLHQAVPGFEKWFGVRPVVDEKLRQLVIDDMEKEQ